MIILAQSSQKLQTTAKQTLGGQNYFLQAKKLVSANAFGYFRRAIKLALQAQLLPKRNNIEEKFREKIVLQGIILEQNICCPTVSQLHKLLSQWKSANA